MELMEYSFMCPNCGKQYSTLVDRKYYQELLDRSMPLFDLFQNFDIPYRSIFTMGYCNTCQTDLGIRYKKYCVEPNEDINQLYNEIVELYRT